jgi:hypothetical protein
LPLLNYYPFAAIPWKRGVARSVNPGVMTVTDASRCVRGGPVRGSSDESRKGWRLVDASKAGGR